MKKYITITLLSLFFVGCNGYLDINTDPNNPSSMTVNKLLPYAEASTAWALSPGAVGNAYGGIGDLLNVYVHQITVRENADKYGAPGSNWAIQTSWRNSYVDAMINLEDIIKKGTADGNMQYVGIAKILKAYLYSLLVDIYGDVPYSEATKVLYPKYDNGADIYASLFGLIDEAIQNLNDKTAANILNPGADDVIYGGDKTKWIKAANTLKLKMLNQVRLVQNVSADVQTLLNSSDNLIGSFGESLMLKFNSTSSPDNRNPAYADTYDASQKTKYISPWFYEILMGYHSRIFYGNKDPRIPYYFYNQTAPTVAAGSSVEYRDGGFISKYFGSDGPDASSNTSANMTVVGIYPAGGLYDDGSAKSVGKTSGTGAAPFRMITYADRLFIEAELIQAGVISGNVRAKLEAAIKAAFLQVDGVVALAKNTSQTIPVLATSTASTTYINNVLTEFDAANADKKMEIIITQKWISSFGNGVEMYNDYRRTGYPILFDPNDPTMAPGGYATPASANGGDPARASHVSPPVKVSCSKNYPVSIFWPSDELGQNPNAPTQKADPATAKVFWDK